MNCPAVFAVYEPETADCTLSFIAAPARERKGKEKFGRLSIEEAVNAHLFLIFAYPHLPRLRTKNQKCRSRPEMPTQAFFHDTVGYSNHKAVIIHCHII